VQRRLHSGIRVKGILTSRACVGRCRIALLAPLAARLIGVIPADPGRTGHARRAPLFGGTLNEWPDAVHATRSCGCRAAESLIRHDETRKLPVDDGSIQPEAARAGLR